MRKVVVFLIVTFVVSSGMATYLYLDCRNLEAELAASSEAAMAAPSVPAVSAVSPTISAEAQLEELRAELAETETARAALEQEVAELEEANRAMEEENTLTMAELAEVAPEAYADFSAELEAHYASLRSGSQVRDQWEALRMLEEAGLLKMDSADRRKCEEYFASYQEYIDGVLDNRWTDEECQERCRELQKSFETGYREYVNSALLRGFGAANWEDAELKMRFAEGVASSLLMTATWKYGAVLATRHAAAMLERDRPPLEYGLSPGEEDVDLQYLEKCFNYGMEGR